MKTKVNKPGAFGTILRLKKSAFLVVILVSLFPKFSEAKSPVPLVRILEIEHARKDPDNELPRFLNNTNESIVTAAITAMGRVGDPKYLEVLSRLLTRKDKDLVKTAVHAISFIPSHATPKILSQNIPIQKDYGVIAELMVALGRTGSDTGLGPIGFAVQNEFTNKEVLPKACLGLGMLWAQLPDSISVDEALLKQLAGLAHGPEMPTSLYCAFALGRYKANAAILPVEAIQSAITKTPSMEAKAFLLRALSRIRSADVAKTLLREAQHSTHLGVRIEAIKGLGGQTYNEELKNGFSVLLKMVKHSSLLAQLLEALGNQGKAAMEFGPQVSRLFQEGSSLWTRALALKALAQMDPTTARPFVLDVLKNPASPLQPDAAFCLSLMGAPEDISKLAEILGGTNPKLTQFALQSLAHLPGEKIGEPIKQATLKVLGLLDPGNFALVADLFERMKWKDFGPYLAQSYERLKGPDFFETRVYVLKALAVLGTPELYPFLQAVIDNADQKEDRIVIATAVETLKKLSGKDESLKIPVNSPGTQLMPNYPEIQAASRARVLLKTSKGEIYLKMRESTPLNAYNFVRLVKMGFYDGLTFHRVVPNFVVQGGDPRGDGFGGPGYMVREEWASEIPERGSVGMATAGKDTGGSQFYFNLTSNFHLNGRYTTFADVIKGEDIIDFLEVNDKIIRATIIAKDAKI